MRIRSRRPTRLAVAAVAALLLGLGCASSSPSKGESSDRRKAASHMDLGVDYPRNDRVALGLRELLIAEGLDPLNPRIQHALGTAYIRKLKFDEAELHLLKAVEIWPEFHDARFNLSTLYLHQERYEECIVEAKTLFDDPTYSATWRALTNRGWAEYKLGKRSDARETLEQALQFNGRYWPALLNLGILEAEQGRAVEAVGYFNRMIDLKPGESAAAEANYRLAEIYVSMGKRDRAVGYLTAAVTMEPGGLWGKKSEEYLKLLR